MAMHKVWMGCGSSNFRSERAGFAPEAIVLHQSNESLGAIDSRCKQPNSFRSAHYCVGKSGEVHQYIEEKDTAFHAGIVVAPSWESIKAGNNPNLYTIGLELESAGAGPLTQDQNNAAADLIAEIAERWKFPLDSKHLVLHSEIRAGARCPGIGFDRDGLLQLVAARRKAAVPEGKEFGEVTLIFNGNVRQAPTSSSRIVRVAVAGSCEQIVGVEDAAERVRGNSCWYATADGNYIWAGATNRPNPAGTPRQFVKQPVLAPPTAGTLTLNNLPDFGDLLNGDKAASINSKSQPAAIGAIQDLLAGHGYRGVPVVVSHQYGQWTPNTTTALQLFQRDNSLNETDNVDAQTLHATLDKVAVDPRASEVYLTLVLEVPSGGLNKILSLVAQMEGAGKFAALNPNTDHAGLSFGLIQWAQKPGRLAELLSAFCSADRDLFVSIFGGADSALADGLLNHCRKPAGGVDPVTGAASNPAFNLIEEPWLGRFRQSALERNLQKAQVQLALQAFASSYNRIRQFAPDITSERGTAFLLDVANQFGIGGASKVFSDVRKAGMKEAELLAAMAEETIARVPDPLKTGVRARREHFLQTPLLSDGAFDLGFSVQ